MNTSTTKCDLSIKQLSELTGITMPTLERLAREGRLSGSYRVGHQWRINHEVFERHRTEQVPGGREQS